MVFTHWLLQTNLEQQQQASNCKGNIEVGQWDYPNEIVLQQINDTRNKFYSSGNQKDEIQGTNIG